MRRDEDVASRLTRRGDILLPVTSLLKAASPALRATMPIAAAAAFVFRPSTARWRHGQRGIAEEFLDGHIATLVWR